MASSFSETFTSPSLALNWSLIAGRQSLLMRITAASLPGIANSGISGNELLADNGSAGIRGVERFTRDVVARPGVRTVVVLIGINDINLADATGAALSDGYRAIVSQAHAAGMRVIGATILPERGYDLWTPAREHQRQPEKQQRHIQKGLHQPAMDGDANIGAEVEAGVVQPRD